jgi:uncharacterized membrane protein YkoI
MKMKVSMALAAALLLTATAGFARESHDEAKKLKDAGEILPLERVLDQARRDQPGRVVETELEREDRYYLYEIKVVDDRGVVHELKYDARSGERLRAREKK